MQSNERREKEISEHIEKPKKTRYSQDEYDTKKKMSIIERAASRL